jgi:hypothetical protein
MMLGETISARDIATTLGAAVVVTAIAVAAATIWLVLSEPNTLVAVSVSQGSEPLAQTVVRTLLSTLARLF